MASGGDSNPTEHDLVIFLGNMVYQLMDDMVKLIERQNLLRDALAVQQAQIRRLEVKMQEWT